MTIWRMPIACWIRKLQIHTLRLCNTECFSTVTVVTRKRLHISLYVHCLSCCMLYYSSEVKVLERNDLPSRNPIKYMKDCFRTYSETDRSVTTGPRLNHFYETCPESKDTNVLNMYNIFNLQKRHCEWITCA
jgi:hypothetical protein